MTRCNIKVGTARWDSHKVSARDIPTLYFAYLIKNNDQKSWTQPEVGHSVTNDEASR